MPEKLIKEYFSQPQFKDKRFPVFESDCEDEGCKLNGNFKDYIVLNGDNIQTLLKRDEKSVDRILFLKKAPNKKVDVILCELTRGKKKYTDVREKIKQSGKYIFTVLQELGFKVRDFKCIFVGNYKNAKRVRPKPFSVPPFHKNNITIKQIECGSEFDEI